jgi:hypothetical protein
MAATPLCEVPLAALKKWLLDQYDEVKSSHLSEALACSLGFRTYASMQAAMVGPEQDRPFVLLNTPRFVARLVQLGYEDDPEFESPRILWRLNTLRGLSHEEVEQVLTRGA